MKITVRKDKQQHEVIIAAMRGAVHPQTLGGVGTGADVSYSSSEHSIEFVDVDPRDGQRAKQALYGVNVRDSAISIER